ncbi:MAG: hypothetical protein ACRD3E_19690, partial [Terriglobales bacterium]
VSGCSVIFGFNTDVKFGTTVYHVQSEAREHDHLLQTQVFVKGRCLGKYAKSFADQAGQADFSEDHLHDLLKAQHKRFVESARAGTIERDIDEQDDAPAAATAHATAAPLPAPAPPPPVAAPADEERISISLDDPDLAAIAEASAAAMIEERSAPPVAPVPIPEEAMAPPVVESPADPMLDSFMAELDAAENAPPPQPLVQYRVEAAGSVIGKGIQLECLEPIVAPDGSSVLLNVTIAEEGTPSVDAQVTCRISVPNGPAAYVYAKSNDAGIADVRIPTQGLDVSTGVLIQAAVRGKTASRKFNLKRS